VGASFFIYRYLSLFHHKNYYFLLLDFGDKKMTWSIKRGIPIVIALYLISLVFSYVWDKHKSDRLKMLNFFYFFCWNISFDFGTDYK